MDQFLAAADARGFGDVVVLVAVSEGPSLEYALSRDGFTSAAMQIYSTGDPSTETELHDTVDSWPLAWLEPEFTVVDADAVVESLTACSEILVTPSDCGQQSEAHDPCRYTTPWLSAVVTAHACDGCVVTQVNGWVDLVSGETTMCQISPPDDQCGDD